MRNRALLLVLASMVMALGCGGGGGSDAPPPPPPGGGVPGAQPGDSLVMHNLPNTTSGRINVAYLPRQGRAIESTTAVIRQLELHEGVDLFIEVLAPDIVFPLGGSEAQNRSASVPMQGAASRTFDEFVLPVETVIYDPSTADEDDETVFDGVGDDPRFRETFPAEIKVLAGRESTMEIRLNDAIITVLFDPFTNEPGDVEFQRAQFEFENYRDGATELKGFISDFISFDVSTMGGDRPQMSTGAFADVVYFTGDRFGLSESGPSGYFEMISKGTVLVQPGEFAAPIPIGDDAAPGEYRTTTGDPNDPSPTPQPITATRGMHRPYFSSVFPTISVVRDPSDFDVVLLPTTASLDVAQIILVARSGSGQATNLYYGDANLSTGTFSAFPVANVPSGSTSGQIDGTLSGFLDASAAAVTVLSPADGERVRYGRYAIGGSLPAGFEASGRFIVIRR